MRLEKLTTSLQFVGAALAVPAGIAGVYSAYHNYFSPEVRCQELRNAALVTLEKNIPIEAKRALLRSDVGQFQAKCSEVEPETAMVFQVALQELEKPAPQPEKPAAKAAQRSAAPARPAPPLLAAAATAPMTPQGGVAPTPVSPAAPAVAAAPPVATTQPVATGQPAVPAKSSLAPGPAMASLGPMARFSRPVRGWVAIEARKPGKATEAFFSGYPADGQSPPPGTILTAVAFRPIWSEPQGQGAIDPTKLQGRIKVGECVRVIGTTASLGRQWAEIEPAACQ